MTLVPSKTTTQETSNAFIGLAPFLRMSIAGEDLQPTCQHYLAQAELNPEDGRVWMNLSTVMLCLGQHQLGLSIQSEALSMDRIYHLAAAMQPAKLRVLLLMAPGDLAANTPLDCLLENSDIDLVFYYVLAQTPFADPIPEHDILVVAMSETDENRELLALLEKNLSAWPKPIINAPQHIPSTGRNIASTLLQGAPGLAIPASWRISRDTLQGIAEEAQSPATLFEDCHFPLIVRPIDSHAGRDLARIGTPAELTAYLSQVAEPEFFISKFIDYSSPDGLFRKFRVALIDGVPYACHMAVSAHWMIHYVNAGMYEDAAKRTEEERFMADFDNFARRHRAALAAIHQRTGLDYLCIDCAEMQNGDLLIFEIDHAMVVHAMDSDALFPYKQHYMQKVKTAFRDYLIRLSADGLRKK